MNGSRGSRTCKNGVAGARDEEAEEPGCPQEISAGPRGACLPTGELSTTPRSLSPEQLPLQNPAPQAAHIVPASTPRAQPGAPGCSDPPPAFNLMKTNGGDNYL